jgi:hypothetical protein
MKPAVKFIDQDKPSDESEISETETDLDAYIEQQTGPSVINFSKPQIQGTKLYDRTNFLQSSFYKSKKYLNAGMLGKNGLKKLRLKIAKRGDENQQMLRNIYGSGPR